MGLSTVTLPAMPRRPARGLKRYNNLAHLGIRFHVPVSLGHLVEAECTVDYRLQLPRGEPFVDEVLGPFEFSRSWVISNS